MLNLTSFMYFLRQIIVSYPREKNVSSSLQKLFLVSSFYFSRRGSAMFAFKASVVRFTLIELSRQARLALLSKTTSSREISAAEVNLVQKVLHEFIFAGVQSETILFQNSTCQCGKNVTA